MLDASTVERMSRKAGGAPILIALSGGGDSVALLHLLAERVTPTRLHAVVVDHALRAGSAADAQSARAMALALGVQAEVRTVQWPGAIRPQQAAAREARYRLLCDAARDAGANVIALGHTRDDQAETVLLRASRGSGWRGLAAMRPLAPAPVWPEGRGLSIARPLLSARRADLRDHLRAHSVNWIEDPANTNVNHARVRIRRYLENACAAGVDPMRLAAVADRLRPFAEALDVQAASLIAQAARFDEGEIVLDRACLRGDATVKQRALDVLVIAASGAGRGAAPVQIEDLCAALEDSAFAGATVGGVRLRARQGDVLLSRDSGALSGRAGGVAPTAPLPLRVGKEIIWDSRVILTAAEPGWSVVFERGQPLLRRGEERRPLAAAAPHWLLRERVQHVLGAG